jgi:pyridoxine 5-phosphate synthase
MMRRRLVVALDGLPSLRDATASADVDLAAAATLAELAGVDAVRLGVSQDLKPVREEDLAEARRAVRCLELRMPPVPALLRVALDLRPDRVLLSAEGGDGRSPSGPVDLRGRPQPIAAALRTLAEAGIPAGAVVAADFEIVKLAHGAGVSFVELHTGAIVDLPGAERMAALQRLADAVRLASKLRLGVGVGGGLGFRSVGEVLVASPALESVAVGRAAVARAMLVGMDRAVRDLRTLVG